MKLLLRLALAIVFIAGPVMWLEQGDVFAAESVILECDVANQQDVLCEGPQLASLNADGDTIQSETDTEPACPVVVGDGVLCTGPTQEMLLVVGEEHPCPLPIGEGVVCTGPEVPAIGKDDLPANGMDIESPGQMKRIFLPFVLG